MNCHLVLWILIMQLYISINKGAQRHCYQADNSKKENKTKVRVARSIYPYDQGEFNLPQTDVCSTWGNFHYRTFDGAIFSFPGLCNYLFASHCGKKFEDFNIQIQQTIVDALPAITQISIKVNGLQVEIINQQPFILGVNVELPYSQSGILIEKLAFDLKISVKLILVLVWHDDKSVHLSLNKKYMGETCGLCSNYDGYQDNDFLWNGKILTPLKYGNLQKLRKPEQTCMDPGLGPEEDCMAYKDLALKMLTSSNWAWCNSLVNVSPYVEAYMRDMCVCKLTTKASHFCLCTTINEYSRQCAYAGGNPPEWRNPRLCFKNCSLNLIYKECNSPCISTCSNPGRQYFCEGTCVSGCFCPKGYVKDDITNTGCIRPEKCPCTYNNEIYPTGSSYTAPCYTCVCSGGYWNCEELPCPSTCSVEGGSHITTFDKAHFTFHGKCFYVLTRPCENDDFLVTIEMKKCAYGNTATCLTRVILFLNSGKTVFEIQYDNRDFPYVSYNEKKMAEAGVLIFWPSSCYMIVHTQQGLYLEVQLTPIMQVYVILDPSYKDKTCGLCGNFNDIQKDDFKTSSGAIEGNVAEFANTWKTQLSCKNINIVTEHPCIYGMEAEKYAHYWCNILIDDEGPFSACHASVNPDLYLQNCQYDTCSCKRAEDCLCAALSSYAWACAAAGIQLIGWREDICRNYIYFCPPSFIFSYKVTTCIPTCRSLSEPDPACNVKFFPVDGCVCPPNTYLNEKSSCVQKEQCSCYYKGIPVSYEKPLLVGTKICSCTNGKLNCTDRNIPACPPPMSYFDCEKAGPDAKGSECPHSCQTPKSQCYSPLCVSGCLCPKGLLLNDNGTCVTKEQCPCFHNGIGYSAGDTVTFHCDQCVCRNQIWVCDDKTDVGICTVYGEGHYITFDSKRYTISEDCEHVLVQDYCDVNNLMKGTFRVNTENIPCGTTGSTCSKAIVAYLGAHKLILTDGHLEVRKRPSEVHIPYKVRNMGNFLVIDAMNGLVLIWDRMTSIFIQLRKVFKGMVCGLCGNFDGNSNNDFTTRSQYVVEDTREFADSWKLCPECPEAFITRDPCVLNPFRVPWAQKHCSIITSDVFSACHAEVDPEKYYEACVSDSCGCDMGEDCGCLCTAIAAYAQACNEACVCVDWRTPNVCPLFCDFYNKQEQCQWYYKPCGAPCMKTCRNPSGKCLSHLKGLEGCYPECPEDKPLFNEHEMICVSQCGCIDDDDNYYQIGQKLESCNSCERCMCTVEGVICNYDVNACFCEYKGRVMSIGQTIEMEDKYQNCIIVTCGINGTMVSPCHTSTKETIIATTRVPSKLPYTTTKWPSTKPSKSSKPILGTTSTSVRTHSMVSSVKSKQTKVSTAAVSAVSSGISTPTLTPTITSPVHFTTQSMVSFLTSRQTKTSTRLTTFKVSNATAVSSGVSKIYTKISATSAETSKSFRTFTTLLKSSTTPTSRITLSKASRKPSSPMTFLTTTSRPITTKGRPFKDTTHSMVSFLTSRQTKTSKRLTTTFKVSNATAVSSGVSKIYTKISATSAETSKPFRTFTTLFKSSKAPTSRITLSKSSRKPSSPMTFSTTTSRPIITTKTRPFKVTTPSMVSPFTSEQTPASASRISTRKVSNATTLISKSLGVSSTPTKFIVTQMEEAQTTETKSTIVQISKPFTSSTTLPKSLTSGLSISTKRFATQSSPHILTLPISTVLTTKKATIEKLTTWKNISSPSTNYSTTAKKGTLGSSTTQVKQDVRTSTGEPTKKPIYIKCINVTCLDNGELHVDMVPCAVVKNITCDNGKMPMKIYDENGCCYHYECQACVGIGGIKRRPGEEWVENCQTCTCDSESLKIFCTPAECMKLDPDVCDKPWLEPLIVLSESDHCCPRIQCGCIPANCNNQAPNCPLGYNAFPIITNDGCCTIFECRAMDVCVVERAVYEVGKFIWTEKSSCKTCQCTNQKDIQSGLNVVSCETVTCNVKCPQGFMYEKSAKDCCGSCVQVSCVVQISNGSLYLLQPGESQFFGEDRCTSYKCNAANQQFVTSSEKIICPEFHEEECESGIIIKTPDGCCDACKGAKPCRVYEKTRLISFMGCSANVTLTGCEGLCSSSRELSVDDFEMDGTCSCCQELEITQEVIELACPDENPNLPFSINLVKKCGCVNKVCMS